MRNISIVGNTIVMPDTAVTPTSGREIKHVAFRLFSGAATVNFPEGQIQGITINGNTVKGYNVGFYFINAQFRNIVISGNALYAKNFTTTGFDASTTLNTYAVMQAFQSGAGETVLSMYRTTFTGNTVFGATYLFATDTAGGGAGTYFTPQSSSGNRFDYIKNIKTADVQGFSYQERFRNNTGTRFLDRTWGGVAMENSFGDGVTSDSEFRFCTQWTGSAYRFYTDDAGTFVTLS
jgi:hypothetical protein